jgi:hypothetical protein
MTDFMPLWESPKAWLELLINTKRLLDAKSLQNLVRTNKAVCTVVLQCMRRWRLIVQVRVGL